MCAVFQFCLAWVVEASHQSHLNNLITHYYHMKYTMKKCNTRVIIQKKNNTQFCKAM